MVLSLLVLLLLLLGIASCFFFCHQRQSLSTVRQPDPFFNPWMGVVFIYVVTVRFPAVVTQICSARPQSILPGVPGLRNLRKGAGLTIVIAGGVVVVTIVPSVVVTVAARVVVTAVPGVAITVAGVVAIAVIGVSIVVPKASAKTIVALVAVTTLLSGILEVGIMGYDHGSVQGSSSR